MGGMTLLQAVRNAIETEHAAESFYRQMAPRGDAPEVRDFLLRVADQEREHAERIEQLAVQLDRGELPELAEGRVDVIETDRDWARVDELDLAAALGMAIELEEKARDYYETLAEASEGELQSLFATLSRVEEEHRKGFAELLRLV